MSQHTLWTCDRCGQTERVESGHRPHHWIKVKRERLTNTMVMGQGIQAADLCRSCSLALDSFLRNVADVVKRAS